MKKKLENLKDCLYSLDLNEKSIYGGKVTGKACSSTNAQITGIIVASELDYTCGGWSIFLINNECSL